MGIVGFDSPSAALALGMGADGVGDLGIDLHGMGVLGGGPGKDEEEKRRRLMNCVDSLKVSFVKAEGVGEGVFVVWCSWKY